MTEIRAMIGGHSILFQSLEEKLAALLASREPRAGMNTMQILGMGPDVIPLLREAVKTRMSDFELCGLLWFVEKCNPPYPLDIDFGWCFDDGPELVECPASGRELGRVEDGKE